MKRLFKTVLVASLFLLLSCGENADKSRLYFDKGYDYLYYSQFEEAIEQFDKAIEYKDDNYEAYFYRACAKYNILQREDALQDYLKVIEINPDYVDAYYNIGLYYRSINDFDMACYYFKIAEAKGRPNMEDKTRHCR